MAERSEAKSSKRSFASECYEFMLFLLKENSGVFDLKCIRQLVRPCINVYSIYKSVFSKSRRLLCSAKLLGICLLGVEILSVSSS